MMKFFRKIRQKLLAENKLSKYLIYAVGEILLLMIGVLLALQVNNWNEVRKAGMKEVANLKSLRSELINTLEELKSDHNSTKLFHEATLKVKSYISKKPEPVDSMYRDFFLSYQFANFFPKTSVYETFKTGNLDLIQSDSLRILITDIYETGYKRILTKVDTRRNAARVLFPYYQEHFRITSDSQIKQSKRNIYVAIPIDYEDLINDPKYESLISEAIIGREVQIRDFEFTIGLVERGISEIDIYLKDK